jgi:hypothetical protein
MFYERRCQEQTIPNLACISWQPAPVVRASRIRLRILDQSLQGLCPYRDRCPAIVESFRPDRRIGQCWEATRAPGQGRRPTLEGEQSPSNTLDSGQFRPGGRDS